MAWYPPASKYDRSDGGDNLQPPVPDFSSPSALNFDFALLSHNDPWGTTSVDDLLMSYVSRLSYQILISVTNTRSV